MYQFSPSKKNRPSLSISKYSIVVLLDAREHLDEKQGEQQ